MDDDVRDLMKKLIMIVSEARKQENDRYENHVKFMSNVTKQIEAFANVLNERWDRIEQQVQETAETLNTTLGRGS